MFSGSAQFRAAAVVSVLAMLVLPSLARCPSLGPAPPPPTLVTPTSPPPLAPVTPPSPPPPAPVTPPALVPVQAPGPAPLVSCNDCIRALIPGCESNCSAYATASCSWTCNVPACDECRARTSNCTACCDAGTCSCDCKTSGDFDCRGACGDQVRNCRPCFESAVGFCMSDCISLALISPCHAPNCTNNPPPPALETPPPPSELETSPPPLPLAPATPPAFRPVLAPGPPPPVSCPDCRNPLILACDCWATVSATCFETCNPKNDTICEECRAMNSNCTTCCNDGTCSCDCKNAGDFNCNGRCYVQDTGCGNCKTLGMDYCIADCVSPCNAICAKDPLYN